MCNLQVVKLYKHHECDILLLFHPSDLYNLMISRKIKSIFLANYIHLMLEGEFAISDNPETFILMTYMSTG